MYRYAMKYRPLSIGMCPRDFVCTEPRPVDGAPFHEKAVHGVLVYDRMLTPGECASFELSLMVCNTDHETLSGYAHWVALGYARYAKQALVMYAEDKKEFAEDVFTRLRRLATEQCFFPPVFECDQAFAAEVARLLR